MSTKTVIVYSSVDGHTLKICNKIRDVFLKKGQNVVLFSIPDFNESIANYDKIMIQFIMWMTKGPTDTSKEIEYTNWDKVNRFGEELSNM